MKNIALCLYGNRSVHRVIDTGGACGGGVHAGTWGCPCRERPGAHHSGPERWRYAPDAGSLGPGEGAISEGGLRSCLRSSESLGYSLGNVRSPTEVAVPRLHLDVVFAA